MPSSEEELRYRLGHHARAARESAGLTLEEIAHRAGMHARHWQKIEAGEVNVTLRTIARVADALKIDAVRLLRPVQPR